MNYLYDEPVIIQVDPLIALFEGKQISIIWEYKKKEDGWGYFKFCVFSGAEDVTFKVAELMQISISVSRYGNLYAMYPDSGDKRVISDICRRVGREREDILSRQVGKLY